MFAASVLTLAMVALAIAAAVFVFSTLFLAAAVVERVLHLLRAHMAPRGSVCPTCHHRWHRIIGGRKP